MKSSTSAAQAGDRCLRLCLRDDERNGIVPVLPAYLNGSAVMVLQDALLILAGISTIAVAARKRG